MIVKTTEQIVADLDKATVEARETLRDLHQAARDTKEFYKHERDRAEQVLREETARAIAAVTDEVRGYLTVQVDEVIADFRRRLLE